MYKIFNRKFTKYTVKLPVVCFPVLYCLLTCWCTVPWLMVRSAASIPGLAGAVGLLLSVMPSSGLTGWAGGRFLCSPPTSSPGLTGEVAGGLLLFSGEFLSLERSRLGWKWNMQWYLGMHCTVSHYAERKLLPPPSWAVYIHCIYLIGNKRTLSLWSSGSLLLFTLSFTQLLFLQPACLFWFKRRETTQSLPHFLLNLKLTHLMYILSLKIETKPLQRLSDLIKVKHTRVN